jgi:cytochrome c oxidase subunit IV
MSDHAHPGHPKHEDHVLPTAVYLKVYGALLVLTYLTVQVSFWALGAFSLPVAMFVAIVKAGLVVGFFMHLRYDTRFHSLVFFGTLLFLAIFAAFTLFDLSTRGEYTQEQDTFALEAEQMDLEALRRAEELSTTPPAERGRIAPPPRLPSGH